MCVCEYRYLYCVQMKWGVRSGTGVADVVSYPKVAPNGGTQQWMLGAKIRSSAKTVHALSH